MKTTLQLALFASLVVWLSACSTTQYDDPKISKVGQHSGNYLGKHRITLYNKREDKYHDRVASPYVARAQVGTTVAAHPDFPFNTRIQIPELEPYLKSKSYRVDDRGRDVTRKRASRGLCYVWDVYVGDPKTMRRLEKVLPLYMDVYEAPRQ